MPVCTVPPKNITLVAFLDKVPQHFANLINQLTEDIRNHIKNLGLAPGTFDAYLPHEWHATLLGMEVLKVGGNLCNTNFLNNNGSLRTIQPLRLLALLSAVVSSRQPLFTVRFGGFRQSRCTCAGFDLYDWKCPSGNAEFHAFNRTAYEGSFYAFSSGPVMLTGWPMKPQSLNEFPRDLFGLRRAAEDCGFLEKYHTDEKPYWKDDDFYIRLGTFKNFPENQLPSLVAQMRNYLSIHPLPPVEVTVDNVDIVYYERAKPLKVIERLPLARALADPRLLVALYGRWTYEN